MDTAVRSRGVSSPNLSLCEQEAGKPEMRKRYPRSPANPFLHEVAAPGCSQFSNVSWVSDHYLVAGLCQKGHPVALRIASFLVGKVQVKTKCHQ